MVSEKEKNKDKDKEQLEKMAAMREEVLRAIKKNEREERLRRDSKEQMNQKNKKFVRKSNFKKENFSLTTNLIRRLNDNNKVYSSEISESPKLSQDTKNLKKNIETDSSLEDKKRSQKDTKVISKKSAKKTDKQKKYCSPKFFSDKFHDLKKTKSGRKRVVKKKTNRLFVFSVVLILICILFLVVGFYVPKSENLLARKISRIVPFPAIIIDGEFISYDYFLQEVDMVNMFLLRQKRMGIIRELPSREKIRQEMKDILIRQAIIKKLARQYRISVSKEEIKYEIDKIKEQSRSEDSMQKMLRDLYGWSEGDFANKVIGPSILSFKLAKKLSSNITEGESKIILDKRVELEKRKMRIYVLVE